MTELVMVVGDIGHVFGLSLSTPTGQRFSESIDRIYSRLCANY